MDELRKDFEMLLHCYKDMVLTHNIEVNHLDQYYAEKFVKDLASKYNIKLEDV